MTISIKAFRKLTNGFARNHHFNIGIVDWRDPAYTNKITGMVVGAASVPLQSMFCSSTTLPAKTFEHKRLPIHHGIPGYEIATNVSYSPWRVTFYSDEILALRFFFLRWMELIQNTDNQSYTLPKRYKSTLAYAAILTPQNIPCHVYTFKGLFPVNVNEITVQQQDTGIMMFDVEFAYDFFQINEIFGFGLALAHEYIGDTAYNLIAGERGVVHKRKINAPLGVSIPVPF